MTAPRLFDDTENLRPGGCSHPPKEARSNDVRRAERVRRSALWSAYGDALGWISELTSETGLRKRTAGAPLHRPIEWKRRIGGRAGVTVTLPKGCYSDDSQLRLATGRSIQSDGFDVEAFSKVELPVWLSYALGGGKATSTAAKNLARSRVQWFANTFRGWTDSGGNGAAMRIQPHVWAARAPDDPATFLPDVVRNAICTHSHPNGLMGAVLHALTLAHAMINGRQPLPDDLIAVTRIAANITDVFQGDVEVGQYWQKTFERDSGAFGDAWARVVDDCQEAIRVAADTSDQTGADRYAAIVDRLKLRDPARRGNGMLTAVAAVGLTWSEPRPESALSIAANATGTDTDTIATMAGAILGVNAESEPPVEVLDADLFRSEADRLSQIAIGKKPQGHQYPDLLHWSAPKTYADALVCLDHGGSHVRGLGHAELQGEPIQSQATGFMWQWLKLEGGQTLLIKRRKDIARISDEVSGNAVMQSSDRLPPTASDIDQDSLDILDGDDGHSRDITTPQSPSKDQTGRSISLSELEAMITYLETHKYDDKIVGQAIRSVVNKCTAGQIGAFLSILIDCLRESSNPPPRQRR